MLLLVFRGAKSVEVKVATFPGSLARLTTRKLLETAGPAACSAASRRTQSSVAAP